MLTVHHLNDSRSQRVLWLLEELGTPYEIRAYARNATTRLAPPELTAVHPLGKSPVIEDDGLTVIESGAIVDYIIRHHGGGRLQPAAGSRDYEVYNQWLHYAEGSGMLPLMLRLYTGRLGDAAAPLKPRIDSELANHLEAVRESERKRIAREIHDELGSLLVALKMDTHWLGRRLEGRAELQCKCQGMGRLIDTAVDNVGRIITDLRPSILDHQGLWAALEWQAQEFIESSELDATLALHVNAGVKPPEGGVAIAVFRIFQEMLSNVGRHAQASAIDIAIDVQDDVLQLRVRDNGVGATRQALEAPTAYGVMGMRERARQLGGQLSITSEPGQGSCLQLLIPLELS